VAFVMCELADGYVLRQLMAAVTGTAAAEAVQTCIRIIAPCLIPLVDHHGVSNCTRDFACE
jgi:hypothetical protein